MEKKALLRELPSVDEGLKSPLGEDWLGKYPRRYVLAAIRHVIDERRRLILEGASDMEVSLEAMAPEIEGMAEKLSSFSLRPVINATGIVVHTNLGRSVLSARAIENIKKVSEGYCNLEYDIEAGKRGKRYAHIKRLLKDVTGAEDGIALNNNAGAVLLALSTIAKGKEAIVSRGELIEIGGSFRIPDVMAASGAILREVGATNKTHLRDYERAIGENTALILKVHRSNYSIKGFTSEVSVGDLAALGRRRGIPVMYDLGSGCLIDLRPFGIQTEPSVREIIEAGPDIVTFSGDKLLGGPQAGIIVGRQGIIEKLQANPLLRALRIDKLTLAALEATLMDYIDEEKARREIPTLRMLLERPEKIKDRAKRVALLIKRVVKKALIEVVEDVSFAGGGALPDVALKTYAVSVRPKLISVNVLEERLRKGAPHVIARITDSALLLDMRTVGEGELKPLAGALMAALA